MERLHKQSAFDHPTIGRGANGVISNEADRVRLCSLDRPCAMCKQRAALGLV